MTKRAIAMLEPQSSSERHPVVRKSGSTSSSSPPLSRAPSPSTSRAPPTPPQSIPPDIKAQDDRTQRFREAASKFASVANRKRYMEIVPHISGPLPGDDDEETIKYRGPPPRTLPPPPPPPPSSPPPLPPQLSQKSLPAVPV